MNVENFVGILHLGGIDKRWTSGAAFFVVRYVTVKKLYRVALLIVDPHPANLTTIHSRADVFTGTPYLQGPKKPIYIFF